jgi:hypothetical protein
MAGRKDKEERKGECPAGKEEAKVKEPSESESDEDTEEDQRKLREELPELERKAAEKKTARELEKKEKERLEELAAKMLLATAAKTGEGGAGGGAGGAGGVADGSAVPKRNHLSVFVVKFPDTKSDKIDGREKYASFPIYETPALNVVQEFMKAESKGGLTAVAVIEKGKNYMVFDHRDKR